MKRYVVVYVVCGIHYRYRCMAKNKRDAIKQCKEQMSPEKIVEVEIEE